MPWRLKLPARETYEIALCLCLCAVILSALPLYALAKYGILTYEDDAYYYFVIARNIHDLGISTFDQQTLTNGYQPLWLGVLLLEYALCGTFDYTLSIELVLLVGALAFLLAALKADSFTHKAALTPAFVVSVAGFTMNGMEAALLIFCLSALFWAIEWLDGTKDRHAALIGLLGALAVGARIDAGVFVLPLLALALPSMRGKLIAIGIIGLSALGYALANLALFGSALPMSAVIKSLGGLQLNHHLIEDFVAQIFGQDALQSADCVIDSACGNSDYFRIVLLIPLGLGLLVLAKPTGIARSLLLTFLIGIAAYAAKLFFFSSWSIWPWYFFPVFIGFYAVLRVVLQRLDRMAKGQAWRWALASALFALVAIPARSYLAAPPGYDWDGFGVINQRAVQRYGALLGGERVAMGDRAGSFAYHYPGPVTQLEGLVEDGAYLRLISGEGDLKTQLCARGVKYVIGYADTLGDYASYRLRALRPWLTSFPGPSLVVSRKDEIGEVTDLTVFNSKDLGDEGDSTLYIWRLSGCPVVEVKHAAAD